MLEEKEDRDGALEKRYRDNMYAMGGEHGLPMKKVVECSDIGDE